MPGTDTRPGGGLGPPSDAPDPLASYRWFILGGFTIVLAAMALYVRRRPKTSPAAGVESRTREVSAVSAPVSSSITSSPVSSPVSAGPSEPAPSGRSGMLFEVLKEELFQLELDHKQERISDDEYSKARAALEQTLERALKREAKG